MHHFKLKMHLSEFKWQIFIENVKVTHEYSAFILQNISNSYLRKLVGTGRRCQIPTAYSKFCYFESQS